VVVLLVSSPTIYCNTWWRGHRSSHTGLSRKITYHSRVPTRALNGTQLFAQPFQSFPFSASHDELSTRPLFI
jgi:hypothetical protein